MKTNYYYFLRMTISQYFCKELKLHPFKKIWRNKKKNQTKEENGMWCYGLKVWKFTIRIFFQSLSNIFNINSIVIIE